MRWVRVQEIASRSSSAMIELALHTNALVRPLVVDGLCELVRVLRKA